ncbi:MAG: hypothetical protein HY902_10825 [Deltaproteobacteria bacterium]|nr:hypothetical protein [Deltaproteobacteria bacterium]
MRQTRNPQTQFRIRLARDGLVCGRLWRSIAALLAVFALQVGCSSPSTTADAGDSQAADGEEDVEQEDVLQPPTLSVSVVAKPGSGNAPLPVEFVATVKGDDPANLFVEWDFGDASIPVIYNLSLPEEAGGLKVKNTYSYKGSYNAHVKVYWRYNSKVKAEASTTVVVDEPVELSLSNVDLISPPTVGMGSDVSLTFSVDNSGDAIANPIQVGIYLSATQVLDDTALLVHSETIAKMDSGKTSQSIVYFGNDPDTKTAPSHFKVPADLPDGDYFILVMVDPSHSLNEANQADNFGVATSLLNVNNQEAAQPDLVITGPEFDGGLTYSPGDSLTYSHEVSNIGEGDAKASKYAVFLSADKKLDYDPTKEADDPSQGDRMLTKLATSNLLKLSPKATLPLNYSAIIPDVPDGDYFLIAAADVKNQLAESNEDNNHAVGPQPVKVKKLVKNGVDLNLVAMTVKPKGTFLGGQVGVQWSVKNAGNTAIATPSPASIYFCPDKAFSKNTCITNQKDFTIPALAAGETKDGTTLVTIANTTPVQNYYIYVRIDPANVVVELDEGNNVAVFDKLILTAQQNVDLWPEAVGVHPASVVAGEKIKVSYTVRNDGTTGAAASTTWIALSPNKQCGASLVAQGLNILISENLDSGADALSAVDVVQDITMPVGLDHTITSWYICVILDAKVANTKETNKGNNAAASSLPIAVTGAKGGCFEDDADLAGGGNNSLATAAPLPANATAVLGSCGNDDWWKVTVPKGNSLLVNLISTPLISTVVVPADLDLEIWAPDGKTLIDGQKLTSAAKKASALTVTTGGDYYIRVAPKTTATKAQYTLQAQVLAPAAGVDLLAGQLTVSPSVTFPGALIKTKFKVTNLGDKAAAPFTVRYLLSQDGKVDENDKILKDVDYINGMDASITLQSTETLLLPIVAGGNWTVLAQVDTGKVIAETNETNNLSLSNTLQLSTTQTCQPDAFAGNHTADTAAALPPSGTLLQALNVCPGLPDWYSIQVPTGKALSVKLNWKYQSGKGLVGVQIIDSSKAGVLAGVASAANSKATIPYVQVGGTYYVHVYVLPETTAIPYDYDVTVTVSEPDPTDVCLADPYESNNAVASAPEIGCGQATLSLCLGDEDWFKLVMKKDEVINLDFNHPGNAYQLKIFGNPNLPPLKTQGGNGKVPFTAPDDGIYYLQASYKSPGIKPTGGFGYTLFVDGGKGVDLLAKIQSVFPSQVVQGEDIYLTVQLSNACQDPSTDFWYGYYFSADNKLDASDALMSLRPMTALTGKASKAVDDKAMIPVDAKPGPAYVIVAADATGSVAESQELNNTDAAAMEVIKLCLPDVFEPNSAPQIASPLLMGVTPDLSLCPYDLDWHTVDLKKGETLTVTAKFDQAAGDLDIRLYKVNKFAAPVAVSATKQAPEQFTYQSDESTKFYLRISGFAGDANAYQLVACKSLTGTCIECLNDSMCAVNQACDPTTTVCGPKSCSDDNLAPCDDANQCTADTCVKGKCSNGLAPGLVCSDADPCTLGETCAVDGSCVVPKTTQVQSLASDATTLVDLGTAAAATDDGGYVVAGARETAPGELRGYVARFAADGKVMWQKSLSAGNSPNVLQGIAVLGDAIVAVGQAGSPSAGWFVRLDLATGNLLSSQLHKVGTASAKFNGLVALPAGSIIAVGSASDPSATADAQDGWAAHLDGDGNLLWQKFLGGAGNDSLFAVALAPSGTEVVAVGQDDQSTVQQGLFARLAVATGAIGTQVALSEGASNTTLSAVAILPNGLVTVAGATDSGKTASSPPTWQAYLARCNLSGAVSSSAIIAATTPQAPSFAGLKTARIYGLALQPDGSLAAAGYSGAASEKAFGFDGMLWLVGSDNQVTASWPVGKDKADVLRAVLPWNWGWLGIGALAELDATSDLLRFLVQPTAPSCDDFNPCTIDSCKAGTGCAYVEMLDGSACGSGTCQSGICTVN